MNANQLINMVVRMFLKKAMSRGIDAGIDRVAKRSGARGNSPKQTKIQAQQAKRAIRMARRAGRL